MDMAPKLTIPQMLSLEPRGGRPTASKKTVPKATAKHKPIAKPTKPVVKVSVKVPPTKNVPKKGQGMRVVPARQQMEPSKPGLQTMQPTVGPLMFEDGPLWPREATFWLRSSSLLNTLVKCHSAWWGFRYVVAKYLATQIHFTEVIWRVNPCPKTWRMIMMKRGQPAVPGGNSKNSGWRNLLRLDDFSSQAQWLNGKKPRHSLVSHLIIDHAHGDHGWTSWAVEYFKSLKNIHGFVIFQNIGASRNETDQPVFSTTYKNQPSNNNFQTIQPSERQKVDWK